MAGNKYLNLNASGQIAEATASQASTGATDAGKIVALNGSGLIDNTMLPTDNTMSVVASEAISAGSVINLWSDAGTLKCRKADATTAAKPAHGYAPAAITSGQAGAVVLREGQISGLSALVIGTEYFLAASPGAVTSTAPSATGNIVQPLGVAWSTTELSFMAHPFVVRA